MIFRYFFSMYNIFFEIFQIVDESRNKCVYPDQCFCPTCIPLANCSNIVIPKNDRCGCPICGGERSCIIISSLHFFNNNNVLY